MIYVYRIQNSVWIVPENFVGKFEYEIFEEAGYDKEDCDIVEWNPNDCYVGFDVKTTTSLNRM